jgi:hypothetical protein
MESESASQKMLIAEAQRLEALGIDRRHIFEELMRPVRRAMAQLEPALIVPKND